MEVTEISLAKYSDARDISLISKKLIEYGLSTTRYSEKRVKEAIKHESKNVAISKQGDTLVGFGIMTYYENSANLDLLAVIPEYQGTGLGQELVSWLEKVALNAGILKIEVQAREINQLGIKFYQKLGYKVIKIIPRVYDMETQVKMTKRLC